VPRAIAVLGLVGGTTITLSTVLVIFGVYGQFSPTGLIVALPVFAWELALAVWLIVKGFTTTPAGAESAGAVSAAEALRPARPEPLAPASSRN
jgi:ABC-type glycerol-3-phosphate transport system permease component